MDGRPTWQGHLRLSLVSCPVALYTATSRAGDVHFNMLHEATGNRIRMIPTDPETGPVDRADIVKGYEIEKDRYVVVTQDEIDNVKLESTHTIDIDRFVDDSDIDRLYWNDPYYLLPQGKVAMEAYGVIREAMKRAGKIALGRIVLSQRERLIAIEPRDAGMVAWSLRAYDEVKQPDTAFENIPKMKADAKMIEIAAKIIEQQEGPFDPTTFKDHYEGALRALIKSKQKGGKRVVTSEPTEEAEVIDLMEALRRSLGKSGAAPKAAAKKAPPAKTGTKKRA